MVASDKASSAAAASTGAADSSDPVKKALASIEKDSWNIRAWRVVVDDAFKGSTLSSRGRETLERFLALYPTHAATWRAYIAKELAGRQYARAELLFKRSLPNCPDVDLWRAYVTYAKDAAQRLEQERVASGTPASSALAARNETVQKAFSYALRLDNVGAALKAEPLWKDYILFLQGGSSPQQASSSSSSGGGMTSAADAFSAFDEGQRTQSVRAAYQQAVVQPVEFVDQLWGDYEAWENSLGNRVLARSILDQWVQRYTPARTVARERKRRIRSADVAMMARPPRGQDRDYEHLSRWYTLIEYERKNPSKLRPGDLKMRVVATYKTALMYMRHYPDLWKHYAEYLASFGSEGVSSSAGVDYDAAVLVLEEALQALAYEPLMGFLYAEFEEACKNYDKARQVYEKLVAALETNVLVYIQYIRFERRCDNTSAARRIFIRARRACSALNDGAAFRAYVAMAEMEWKADGSVDAASKVYALGAKEFATQPQFITRHIDFLLAQRDFRNASVAFEQAFASSIPPSELEPLWDRFIEFHALVGDLSRLRAAEARRARALKCSQTRKMVYLLERYSFLGELPCSENYVASLHRLLIDEGDLSYEPGPGSAGRGGEQARAAAAGSGAGSLPSILSKRPPPLPPKELPLPDVSNLIAYRPGIPFSVPMRARGPLPTSLAPALLTLLKQLPPAIASQGLPIPPRAILDLVRGAVAPEAPKDAGIANGSGGRKRSRFSSGPVGGGASRNGGAEEADLFARRRTGGKAPRL